ncbi:restriction endonuclease subunit S [Aliarcobacter butzleri]|uniref:restriction endonuclease subunit S n=1 Tax=Aliarcobacter butzleri TaxID=28197 RepID=UPI0012F83EF8|nr:restriction endonuclease subunit S [Aliarcobacter butzleri]
MNKEIKQGYKQTKVGIIPDDWEVVKVGEVCDCIVPGRNKPENFNGDIPWVTTPDIVGKYISDTKSKLYISADEAKKVGSKIVPKNSVIMSCVGELGLLSIVTNEIVINQQLHAFLPSDNVRTEFLHYALHTQRKYMDSVATKTAVPYMNKDNCNSIPIVLPPIKEQEKIAEILSTWDEAITKQEKLIKLKELQKKALMKKLLSGEVRFDEFNDKWEELRLRDICYIKKGDQLNKDTLDSYGNFPVINGGIEPSGYIEEWNTEENTITISEGGNSCGYVNFIQDKFWSGGHCYTLLNLKIDKIFLFQFLKYNQHNIMKLRVGSGLPNIQKSAIEKFSVNKPSLPEQQKIAGVLSLADDEINFLRNELKELKLQKKALMQKLLTGEVRIDV